MLTARTPEYIKQIERYGRPIFLVEHHAAHAASAFFGSGWDNCYALTADGWGEDASSTFWRCRGTSMKKLSFSNTFDSLGYFYGAVTKSLGYIPHRHEGKVLGLAAHVSNPVSYPILRDMISYDSVSKRFLGHMERGLYQPGYDNPELTRLISDFPREDVASAAQQSLEEVVCDFVSDLGVADIRLAVAGGVFANVRLNQKLRQLPNVDEIFVFPNMGDGGLSIGAAWIAHAAKTKLPPEPLNHVMLGDNIDDKETEHLLRASGLQFNHYRNIEHEIASLISKGHVVARCNGRMEFGPRSLGNRSILYQATDPTVNQWLNAKLKRSEFMPFAPATRLEDAADCYIGITNDTVSCQYMTVTVDCTELMRRESPAAVHIDGSARPQIVSQTQYPEFHKIISEYKRLTGYRSIINTSFNMHEEPIVRTAEDALRAFSESTLPYLALGKFIVQGDPIGMISP